jgi:hypothetical protein
MESLEFIQSMPPKGESVQTYLQPEAKRELEAWAAQEQRSISFLVAQILMEALATRRAQNDPPPLARLESSAPGAKAERRRGGEG